MPHYGNFPRNNGTNPNSQAAPLVVFRASGAEYVEVPTEDFMRPCSKLPARPQSMTFNGNWGRMNLDMMGKKWV
jgi:hypothetical protein